MSPSVILKYVYGQAPQLRVHLLFTHQEEIGMSIIRYLQWHILNLFFVFLNFL
jgi:hypothetical protein